MTTVTEHLVRRAFAHAPAAEALQAQRSDPVYERGTPTVRDFPPGHPVVERARVELKELKHEISRRTETLKERRETLAEEATLIDKMQVSADYLTAFLEPTP